MNLITTSLEKLNAVAEDPAHLGTAWNWVSPRKKKKKTSKPVSELNP